MVPVTGIGGLCCFHFMMFISKSSLSMMYLCIVAYICLEVFVSLDMNSNAENVAFARKTLNVQRC